MGKRRCQLCGGKLSGNICTECGLDNSKNDENYRQEREVCSAPARKVRTTIFITDRGRAPAEYRRQAEPIRIKEKEHGSWQIRFLMKP